MRTVLSRWRWAANRCSLTFSSMMGGGVQKSKSFPSDVVTCGWVLWSHSLWVFLCLRRCFCSPWGREMRCGARCACNCTGARFSDKWICRTAPPHHTTGVRVLPSSLGESNLAHKVRANARGLSESATAAKTLRGDCG